MSISAGKFEVLKEYRDNSRSWYDVVCSCGAEKTLRKDFYKRVQGTCNRCPGYDLEYYKGKEYGAWDSLRQRCNNPTSNRFEHYGGRGIIYDPRWEDFKNFLEDMGECPPGLSLDRIDVNGNYCKENCRWADSSMQTFNQKRRVTNSSGRTGVRKILNKKNKVWSAFITFHYKNYDLGCYDSFEEAVAAREKAEIEFFGFTKE